MPVLNARLLGPPAFRMEGGALEPSAGKVRALLCYLVATRQVHSRERLAGFFWPDVPERNALASLRTGLYDLRQALGDHAAEILHVERTRVGLSPDLELQSDVGLLEAVGSDASGAQPATLAEAVDAYGGPFLEGISVPDAYGFDDWVFLERERLANLYLGALCQLGERHAAEGDFAGAANMARRVLAIDPLREEIHRALMRYLALDGQRGAAIAQYRSCAKLLERELGIEPLAATSELFQRIAEDRPLAEDVAAPTAVGRAAADRARQVLRERPELPKALTAFDGPLIGRQRERDRLARAWRDAAQGRGGLMILTGEAGIGKTRLVADLAAEAGEEAVVLLGRCWESATHEPFTPFVQALRGADSWLDPQSLDVAEVWLRELARLLPELAERLPAGVSAPLDGVRDRDRLFEGVRAVLTALSQDAPLLLVIDDVQWADETSLALLSYLARGAAERGILLVATCRDEDVTDERRAALRRLEGLGRRLRVERFSTEQTAELISALGSGNAPAPRLGQRLHARTGGNPLFLIETLRSLFEQGSLRTDERGAWTTTAEAAQRAYEDLPVPESVGLIVDGRLERLSDDARLLAECAAGLRRDFSFDLVQKASNLAAPAALDALDQLLAIGILREADGDDMATRYDFRHALVRDRIYGLLSGARRQFLHRQLAGLMETAQEVTPDRVAYHYMRGGVRDRACQWSLRAGEAALAVHAAGDALAHYRTAGELAVQDQEAFGAQRGTGDAFVALGRPEEAVGAYRDALGAAPDEEARAELLRRIGRAHDRQGRYEDALNAYDEARVLLRGRPGSVSPTAIRVADGIATVYVRIGRVEEATALCRDALVLLEMCGLDDEARRRAEAWVRNTLGMAQLHGGDYDAARRSLQRSLELKRALSDPLGEATLRNNLGVVAYHCGDDEQALEHYAESLRIKDDIGDLYGAAIALTNLALIETHLQRFDDASVHLERAERSAREVDASWLVPEIERVAAQQALSSGRIADGLSHAERALEAAEGLGVPAFIGVAHRVLGLAKAHASAEERSPEGAAEEHFQTSLAVFEMLSDQHELAKTRAAFGEALLSHGRALEARDHLRGALQTFRESGAHGRARRVRRLLAERDLAAGQDTEPESPSETKAPSPD